MAGERSRRRNKVVPFWGALALLMVAICSPFSAWADSGPTYNYAAPTLAGQSTWVGSGGTFSISLDLPAGVQVGNTRLEVTVYSKLESRSGFVQTLQGHLGTQLSSFPAVPLDQLVNPTAGGSIANAGSSVATSGSSSSIGPSSSNPATVPTVSPIASPTSSPAPPSPATSTTSTTQPASGQLPSQLVANFAFEVNPPAAQTTASPTLSPNPAVPYLNIQNCFSSGCSGVYPVEVQLVGNGGNPLSPPVITHLIYLDSTSSLVKLGFGWTIPVFAPAQPAKTSSKSTATTLVSHSPSPNLDNAAHLISILAHYPQVPYSIQAVPQTVESLESSGKPAYIQALQSLSSLIAPGDNASSSTGTHQLVQSTYVPVSLSSLSDSGLGKEILGQFQTGQQVLSSILHVKVPSQYWVDNTTFDQRGLSALVGEGISSLVLPESDLEPISNSITVTQPWMLSSQSHYNPTVATSDSGLFGDISSTGDPILAAHRVLADLAQIWSDAPNQTEPPRAVMYASPTEAVLNPSFVSALLEGLSNDPIIQPMSLSSYFSSIPVVGGASHPSLRTLVQDPKIASIPAEPIRSVRNQVDALSSAFPPGSSRVAPLNFMLLSSQDIGISSEQRAADLTATRSAINNVVSKISISGTRTVTLTSQSGTIPITISNALPYPVQASVTISSDKFEFPHGATKQVTLSSATNTASFPVKTRVSGEFQFKVTVWVPSGGLVLTSALFTVRSTAFSGVAIWLTAVALGFLMVWWGRSVYRSRKHSSDIEGDEEEYDDNEDPSSLSDEVDTPTEVVSIISDTDIPDIS